MKELSEKELIQKAAAYCSGTERCPSEVESKLTIWGANDMLKRKIIEILTTEKYIDEERFCRSFINDKFRFNKWGKLKIAQAIRQKGIAQSSFQKFLEEIDESEYWKVLSYLINEKRKNTKAKNAYELNGKLIRFALSRGFSMDDIRHCLKIESDVEMD